MKSSRIIMLAAGFLSACSSRHIGTSCGANQLTSNSALPLVVTTEHQKWFFGWSSPKYKHSEQYDMGQVCIPYETLESSIEQNNDQTELRRIARSARNRHNEIEQEKLRALREQIQAMESQLEHLKSQNGEEMQVKINKLKLEAAEIEKKQDKAEKKKK